MRLAVQLLTWNGEPYLSDCLSSLENQVYKDWHIFAADNHSSDNSAHVIEDWIRKRGAGVFKKNTSNIGFARGHNDLLRLHEAEYVCVLNQDVFLEPNYLDELRRCLDQRNSVGSASGCLRRWQNTKGKLVKTDIMDSAGLKIYKTHRVVERGRGEPFWTGRSVEDVFGVPATAALYRRTALDEAALMTAEALEWFDNDFISYKEDIDLAYRLCLMGWRSVYVPAAQGYHYRGLRGAADAMTGYFTFATLRQRAVVSQSFVLFI